MKEIYIPEKRPLVDIIIPFYGQYESVLKCLSAIQNTTTTPYRMFFIDDCSPNVNFLEELSKGRTKLFGSRLETRSGFAACVNEGIEISNADFICIMHSDIYPNNIKWLPGLIDSLKEGSKQNVGIISSRMDNVGTANDYPKELLVEGNDNNSIFTIVKKPIPLTCCLFERKTWNKIGGLHPYPFAWYEDIELFYRMKKLGLKQAVSGISMVHHEGGKTIKDLAINDYTAYEKMKENICLFKKRLPLFSERTTESMTSKHI